MKLTFVLYCASGRQKSKMAAHKQETIHVSKVNEFNVAISQIV